MKGLNLKKGAVWGVILFLVVLGYFFSQEADASETSYEIAAGITQVGGIRYESADFLMKESFDEGKYHIGLLLQTGLYCIEGERCRGESDGNQAFFVQRVVRYGDAFLGLGFSYWHDQTPAWDSHTPFALSIGYELNEHVAITWRHFSTGGSSERNPGLDFISVSYTF